MTEGIPAQKQLFTFEHNAGRLELLIRIRLLDSDRHRPLGLWDHHVHRLVHPVVPYPDPWVQERWPLKLCKRLSRVHGACDAVHVRHD